LIVAYSVGSVVIVAIVLGLVMWLIARRRQGSTAVRREPGLSRRDHLIQEAATTPEASPQSRPAVEIPEPDAPARPPFER
jgi:hypothetical protein